MKVTPFVLSILFSLESFGQWVNNGDNATTGNLTVGGAITNSGNQIRFSELRGLLEALMPIRTKDIFGRENPRL